MTSSPISDVEYEVMSRDAIITEGIMSPSSEKSDYELMEMGIPTDKIVPTDESIYDVPKSYKKLSNETTPAISDIYDVPRSLSTSPLDLSGGGAKANGQHDSNYVIDPSAIKNTPTQDDNMHDENVIPTGSPAPSDYSTHGPPPERDAWGVSYLSIYCFNYPLNFCINPFFSIHPFTSIL